MTDLTRELSGEVQTYFSIVQPGDKEFLKWYREEEFDEWAKISESNEGLIPIDKIKFIDLHVTCEGHCLHTDCVKIDMENGNEHSFNDEDSGNFLKRMKLFEVYR